jgi:membrane protein YdbS with pleckstrin-like domain
LSTPEPAPGSPFKTWQWAEIWVLVAVIAVQLWLYRVSLVAAAAWGLLVPALVVHIYVWMVPLLREQRRQESSEQDPDSNR